MSDDIIKRLRGALSSRPTAGPWVVMPANAGEQCVARINSWEAVPPNGVELARDFIDAAYIAAASPDNIAALLDRLDKAERENERLRAERDEHARWRVDLADKLHDAESQISAAWTALRRAGIQSEETVAEAIALLHAENERLREDAARYQWLRGDSCPDHSPRWTQWEVRCWKAPSWTGDLRRADLDDAIDAAIDAARGKE